MPMETARVAIVAASALGLASCRGASGAHSETRPVASPTESVPPCASHDAMHWRGAGRAIEVRARNGTVRATPASDDRIDIVARAHDTEARLRVIDREGILVACVVTGGEDDEDACGGDEWIDESRVQIEVRVPRGVRFVGWTANGAIEASGLEGDVEAHAQNGSIALSTSGEARASTVNGSIAAKIGAKRWEGTLALETVNGHVRVDLAEGAGARVSAETVHGKIGVGVKLEGEHVEATRVEGRIGAGGGRLRLRSVNGGIDID